MKRRARLRHLLWFLLGAACFALAQPLTRLPLLAALQGTAWFTLFSVLYPLAALACVALSAGIFEEGARFLFKLLLPPARCSFSQPLLFGLGHGLMEACLVLAPAILAGYSLGQLWLGVVERLLAVALHICLTVVVWNGFQQGRRARYLLLAVAIHGLVDFVLPALQLLGMPALAIEAAFAVMVLVMGLYAMRSQKYYSNGGHNDETPEQL